MNETLINILMIPCGLFMFFLGRAQIRELTKVPKEDQSKHIWQNQKLMGYGFMACGIFSMLVGAAKTIWR